MDSGTTTTRKGFLQRAGLAIAGVFTLAATSRSNSPEASKSAQGPGPMARVRKPQGIVERKA